MGSVTVTFIPSTGIVIKVKNQHPLLLQDFEEVRGYVFCLVMEGRITEENAMQIITDSTVYVPLVNSEQRKANDTNPALH